MLLLLFVTTDLDAPCDKAECYITAQDISFKIYHNMESITNITTPEYIDKLITEGIKLGIDAGKNIIIAIIIYFVGKSIIKLTSKLLNKMLSHRNVDATLQSFLMSFVNILLTILLIITIVSTLGVNTTSFAALIASAGVAVGMALSGNLQNLAGGLIILLFRPFKVGDVIETGSTLGKVASIQIFHTILVTFDNKKIYLPNGSLSSGNITNYTQEELRRVDLTIGITYGEDIAKVRSVLTEIFDANPNILKDPAPFVGLGDLAASSVDLTIRVWTKGDAYWDVYFGLNETIYNRFNEVGIEFPFPQLTIHQGK